MKHFTLSLLAVTNMVVVLCFEVILNIFNVGFEVLTAVVMKINFLLGHNVSYVVLEL
jgi:hypothetical protein